MEAETRMGTPRQLAYIERLGHRHRGNKSEADWRAGHDGSMGTDCGLLIFE